MNLEIISLIMIFLIFAFAIIFLIYSLYDLRRMNKRMQESHDKFMELLDKQLEELNRK